MKKTSLLIIAIILIATALNAGGQTIPGKMKNDFSGRQFIENKGQWPAEVKYLAKANGMRAWITNSGVVYDFFKVENTGNNEDHITGRIFNPQQRFHQNIKISGHVVKMDFKQKPGKDQILEKKHLAIGKKSGYFNYFIGSDKSKWSTKVQSFNEIRSQNVFKGIDVRYYFDQGGIRYDFIVEPGADPSAIKMDFDLGSDDEYGININEKGELLLNTSLGVIKNQDLFAYQIDDKTGNKQKVNCAFSLNGKGEIEFSTEEFDRSKELIIDPLVYSTFLGGDEIENFNGFDIDNSSNVVIGGTTFSSDFPTTPGAYTNKNGGFEAFVTKLNSDGTGLVFSSVYGGSTIDYVMDIDIDSYGDIYVSGGTYSFDFPVTPDAFDPAYDKIADAYLLKLSADGSTLLYSTYFGGMVNDDIFDIIVTSSNEIFLAGMTSSSPPEFPVTPGAFDITHNGYYDFFVAKFNSDHSLLEYCTYLGGSDYDGGWLQMTVDEAGNAYVTGTTFSPQYPVTVDAYDGTYNGNADMVLTVFDNSGSSLIYSTFIGGNNFDQGRIVEILEDGRLLIFGQSSSTDYPVTPDAYNTEINGSDKSKYNDIIITILNPDLQSLNYSSYLGGDDWDFGFDMVLDENENIIFTGATKSNNYPTTADAFSQVLVDDWDAILSKFNFSTNSLSYSTYFGGDEGADPGAWEEGWRIVRDGYDVVIAGTTPATDFPITADAYDKDNVDWDVYISKFSLVEENPPIALCSNTTVELANGSASINADDIDNGSYDDSGIASMTVDPSAFDCSDIGNNEVTLTVTDIYGNTSKCSATVEVIGEIPEVDITVSPSPAVDPGGEENTIYIGYGPQSLTLTTTSGYTYEWSSDDETLSSDEQSVEVSPTSTTEYTVEVTNEYGCKATESVTINVYDYQAGNNNHQMWICHNGKTIRVSKSSVPAHLTHGDALGPCPSEKMVESPGSVPKNYYLKQNYPNPFSGSTTIEYGLPESGLVKIEIFDLIGNTVGTLIKAVHNAGNYVIEYNNSDLPEGIYFYSLSFNGATKIKQMIKLK